MANKAAYSPAKILSIFFCLCLLELMDMTVHAKQKSLDNVLCKTYETVVPVDPINHGYYPFYVKLHRCAGSASTISPKVQHCAVGSYEELNIRVYSRSSSFTRSSVTLKNHTSCRHACVNSPVECDLTVQDWDEKLCACKCRYPQGPPKELACKNKFRWDSHTCKCECDRSPEHCPYRMVWSKDICGCRCDESAVNDCTQRKMGIDVNCQCVDVQAYHDYRKVQSRAHMFITLLIGQAVLIILLICALVHWVRKRNQQNSAHSPLDRLDSCKTNDEISAPYLEVAVESDSSSSVSLDGTKDSSDEDSYTAPLSPKDRVTDI